MMGEEKDLTKLSKSIQEKIQQIVKQNSSLSKRHAEELETVLTELAALPFKDEIQQANFLEQVQSLQGYHIIQIFNLGVAPLQSSLAEPSIVLLEDVNKLVDICISFCYTSDVSKRVAFDYYIRALKFCFPLDTKQCLSTEVLFKLLQIVQIFQEGKLAEIVADQTNQVENSTLQINGTNYFFGELLQIFELRRQEGYLVKIIEHTLGLASVDAKLKRIQDNSIGEMSLQSENMFLPVFVKKWMKLMRLTNVSDGFLFSLANVDSLHCIKRVVPSFVGGVVFQQYESTVSQFLNILEEMNSNGSEIRIPNDEERLGTFFSHLNHFNAHPYVIPTSLRLLAATSVTNEVLRKVLDELFHKERVDIDAMKTAFHLVFEVLSVLPDGKVVGRVFKLWKEAFSGDPVYQTLSSLLKLFVEGPKSEKFDLEMAERILDFLEWLPITLRPWLNVWQRFLLLFIKIFPSSFQRRPEVLVFIHKAVLAKHVSPVWQQAFFYPKEVTTLELLEWLSQQSCEEEIKSEMIWLLMCFRRKEESSHRVFDAEVIETLALRPHLSFTTKKQVLTEITNMAAFFTDSEKECIKQFIENITSNASLQFTEEILFEFLDFIKRFIDKQRPRNILLDILAYLPWLSMFSVSGARQLKVMQLLNKSEKGLLTASSILKLIETHQYVLEERTNEYFDILFPALVDTLEEDDALCEQFCKQLQVPGEFPSADVLIVWTSVVAGLISLELFKENIDSICCCSVLQCARQFDSPLMILELLSQVRSTAVTLTRSSRSRVEAGSSCNETDSLINFVTAVTIILNTDAFSSSEKLRMVKKVCGVSQCTIDILSTNTLGKALKNLIPYFPWRQSTFLSTEGLHLEFDRIVDVLDNTVALQQLSRIPVADMNRSLCSVLSTEISDPVLEVNLVEVLLYIGSLKDLHEEFFNNLFHFVEVARQEFTSMEDILQCLKELVQVLRSVRSELIPLTMLNFAYLLKHHVDKHERNTFLTEVAMRWKLSFNHSVLSFLEIPRILWKAYNTASASAEGDDLINRVQEILKKNNYVEHWVRACPPLLLQLPEHHIRRRTACCELEWLVFHSSLTSEDAALAFDLSCFSFNRLNTLFGLRLKCLTFSDVQIEDGAFQFVSQQNETTSDAGSRSRDATSSSPLAPTENVSSPSELSKSILTPALMAKEVINQLKRLLGQETDVAEDAFLLWKLVFMRFHKCDAECALSSSFLDDYVDIFLSMLAESASKEVVFHWAKLDKHHFIQCSKVILKACKWNNSDDCIDKGCLLNLQTVVTTTLEKMRSNTRTETSISSSLIPLLISFAVSCFRLLKPELQHCTNMLERRLSIEVTTGVLELYQINVQAGVAVGEIVSLWSSKEQSLELVRYIQSFCEGHEISTLNTQQSEFVWQLLKAFGCFCMDSCEHLQAKFKELIVLHGPEDDYGLNRLPKWRQAMIADGFPARVINDWCVAFLMTPLEDLTSRDVDAIVDLNFRSLKLVASVSQDITQIIFPENGFEVKQGEGIKKGEIKERIRLARLLGEFINILRLRNPEENPKDADVRDIVVAACSELCTSHKSRKGNDLYSTHDDMLKSLFTEIFGKRRIGEDGQVIIQDCGMAPQTGVEELNATMSIARQSSYLHENLPSVLSHRDVYEPMVVLLRRWLSGIVRKPTLASHTLEVVQLLFSVHTSGKDPSFLEQLHSIIQGRVFSLDRNQSLMSQLQAAGYNKDGEDKPDLWTSPTVELPCYLSKRESPSDRLFTKKLTEVLRRLWNEWKDILFMCRVPSIKVGEEEVCTKDLFGVQVSLKEMEEQVAAVKEKVKQVNSEHFKSDDLDRRVERLMRREQQHRKRIEKLYKSANNRVSEGL